MSEEGWRCLGIVVVHMSSWYLRYILPSFVSVILLTLRNTLGRKKGTNSILGITLTKFNTFSQFILTFKITEKIIKVPSLLAQHYVMMTSKCRFHEKRETPVHFAATVASKFTRFKSGGLQRVEYTAREGVQNTQHWSRQPQTSHQNRRNWVGASWITPSLLQLCASGVVVFRLVSGRAMVTSSTAFNSDSVFSW